MKYRIFIVEDDETIANLLKKHLSSWGYEVFLAEDFSNVLWSCFFPRQADRYPEMPL